MFASRLPSLRWPSSKQIRLPRHPSSITHNSRRRFAASLSSTQQKSRSNRKKWTIIGGLGAGVLLVCALGLYKPKENVPRPLSTTYFSPTTLASSEIISRNTKLIRLKVPPEVAAGITGAHPIWSVNVKNSDIQIERPYTPLEGLNAFGELEFWIKSYPNGEMGRWLHARRPGEIVDIRATEQTWDCESDSWDNIVMISGGTGVAPFIQLLHTHFSSERRSSGTKFTLLHSYNSPSDLPPSKFLERFVSWSRDFPERFQVATFVDVGEAGLKMSGLNIRRINKDDLKSVLRGCAGNTAVLVCGPDVMVNAFAGPRARDLSQGPIGGMLGELQRDIPFDVWKL